MGKEKVKNRKEKELLRGKYFYSKQKEFSKENTTAPKKFLNKVVCGDSLATLKELPDNCIDLVFTSPPYNFGLDYESTNDSFNWKEYFDSLFPIFKECIRVLKYSGRFIINVQPSFSDYVPTHHIISNFMMENGLIWRGEIMWEKNHYNCKITAWGSWASPSSPYLKYTWEFLEVFCKGSLKKPGKKEDIDISGEEFKKWVTAKWSIAPERRMEEFDHPAMFPEELVARVLKLFTYKNDVVLDPFNGAGSLTYIAEKLHRNYIGIDISDEYCDTANGRMDQMDLFGTNFNSKE
jgi:DNA modification methylase